MAFGEFAGGGVFGFVREGCFETFGSGVVFEGGTGGVVVFVIGVEVGVGEIGLFSMFLHNKKLRGIKELMSNIISKGLLLTINTQRVFKTLFK